MKTSATSRALVAATLTAFLGSVVAAPAMAAIVDTAVVLDAQQRAQSLATVNAALDRADVQQKLSNLGVDPAEAKVRAAAMTDAELAQLSQRIHQLPAGGDALAIVGLVFVVLLVLEYTGAIDIFKKVP